jgi:two-component system, NtrC family, response regulator GlrR
MAHMKVLTVELGDSDLAKTVRYVLLSSHDKVNFEVRQFLFGDSTGSMKELNRLINSFRPDVVLLITADGFSLHIKLILKTLMLPTIVVSKGCDADEVMDILRLGAADFIAAPVRDHDLIPRIWRLAMREKEKTLVTESLKKCLGLENLVGRNISFLIEVEKIPVVARCDVNVLITGETGTGKELFARAIHYLSPRSGMPFVAVNCGSIPADLAENELFGHAKGAFTGAESSAAGLITEADGGTLFLDDIDCLPLHVQVKLLRFLQEKEFKRLGSSKTEKADVRVLASSNGDLWKAVEDGTFRKDLFYRLNVIFFKLLPLRDRPDDIPLLADHFLKKYAAEFNRDVRQLSETAISQMIGHNWSGNVRELENVIERAVIFASGPVIENVQISMATKGADTNPAGKNLSLKEAKAKAIDEFEKGYIKRILAENGGNITRSARVAQKNRRAFFELMRKHHIAPMARPDKIV